MRLWFQYLYVLDQSSASPFPLIFTKQPKISDQGSCAQTAMGFIRLALTLEGYPDKKLGIEECSMIRKLIRGHILQLSEGKAPMLSGSWERDDAFVFARADEQSGDLLKSFSS